MCPPTLQGNIPTATQIQHTSHSFTQLVYKSLYCLVDVILPFPLSDPDVPPPPLFISFFCSTQPLRNYNHQHENESVTAHFKSSIPALCCVIVYLFSFLAVLILVEVLVVWCCCCWWCCACVEEYPSMVLISCHLLDEPSQTVCSLPSSTPPPPDTDHPCGTSHLQLQLLLLSNPVVIIIFHTFMKDAVHIHHSFGCCFPPSSSSSFHHRSPPPTPPPAVMDIFLDLASQAASCFHSVSADCRMSPS